MMHTIQLPRQTLDQRRSAHAWSAIKIIVTSTNPRYLEIDSTNQNRKIATDTGKKLGTEIKKLPVRVLTSGLGQAIAFLHAKETAPILEKIVAHWLLEDRPPSFDNATVLKGHDIIQEIMRSDAAILRDMTEETLAYLPWLCRFGEAVGLMERPQELGAVQ
jgi:CRISPR-associated protein Cmr5